MKRYGFLAIWCEIASENLEDYRNWLTQEHIADRTFSPGFLGVRLFEALDDPRSHFILYVTQSIEVLQGAAYKAILDNPSPWTERIMPKFGAFDRALGEQLLKVGNGFGSHIVVWRVQQETGGVDLSQARETLSALAQARGVASVRLYQLDRGVTDRESQEKTMRKGVEGNFHYLLCAETMGETAARQSQNMITPNLDRIFPALGSADILSCRMIYGEAPHEGPSEDEPGRRGRNMEFAGQKPQQ